MSDDPVGSTAERLQGYVTLAITVAARIMEVQAQRRAHQLRETQRRGEHHARQVADQQRAEVAATRHQLRDVGRKEWWDSARPEDVATAYATARAYGHIDPELAGTARYMAEEIGRRYGVDADRLVEETVGTDAWMAAVGTEVGMATSEKVRGQLDDTRRAAAERVEAVALVTEANVMDRAVHADGVVTPREAAADLPAAAAGWDEAGRREGLAARLERLRPEQPEAVQARLASDALQGRPAAVAPAAHGQGRPPRARNAPAQGQERVRGR